MRQGTGCGEICHTPCHFPSQVLPPRATGSRHPLKLSWSEIKLKYRTEMDFWSRPRRGGTPILDLTGCAAQQGVLLR